MLKPKTWCHGQTILALLEMQASLDPDVLNGIPKVDGSKPGLLGQPVETHC